VIEQLEELARAVHDAGVDDEASRRLLELAAIAAMKVRMLEALLEPPEAGYSE
jgi:hypothetical protein